MLLCGRSKRTGQTHRTGVFAEGKNAHPSVSPSVQMSGVYCLLTFSHFNRPPMAHSAHCAPLWSNKEVPTGRTPHHQSACFSQHIQSWTVFVPTHKSLPDVQTRTELSVSFISAHLLMLYCSTFENISFKIDNVIDLFNELKWFHLQKRFRKLNKVKTRKTWDFTEKWATMNSTF